MSHCEVSCVFVWLVLVFWEKVLPCGPDWLWILNLPTSAFQVLGLQVFTSPFLTLSVVLICISQMIKDIYWVFMGLIGIHFVCMMCVQDFCLCFKLNSLHSSYWIVIIRSTQTCVLDVYFARYICCKYFSNLLSTFCLHNF